MAVWKQWVYSPDKPQAHICNCVGPQDGKPLCPCRMRNVQVRDGRYVEIIDHGPVDDETLAGELALDAANGRHT